MLPRAASAEKEKEASFRRTPSKGLMISLAEPGNVTIIGDDGTIMGEQLGQEFDPSVTVSLNDP